MDFTWFSRKVRQVWEGGFVAAHQVLAHARLANVDAELEQLSVNPRSAPEWILAAHLPNPCAHLLRHGWPPRLTVSDLPGPEPTKAFSVPADDVSGWTMIMADRRLRQMAAKYAHKNRSEAVSLGRFTDRSRTWSWCRRAMTSI